MDIEKELHEEMLNMYKKAGEETGYWGNYFLRSVRKNGGVATAKKMLTKQSKSTPAKGLQALIQAKRLDLSLEALILQPKFQNLFNKEELDEARRRLSIFSDSYFQQNTILPTSLNSWILQGNPGRFNIDDYLSRYSFIYWSATQYKKDFNIGDIVYIWRSGKESGAVAIGILEELPTQVSEVHIPAALGDDLWKDQVDAPTEIKVGIRIEQVRLTPEEGMITRDLVKKNPILGRNPIITQPNNTVFKLNDDQNKEMARLWGRESKIPDPLATSTISAPEGSIELHYHYQRERSSFLVKRKKENFLSINGFLRCEICRFSFEEYYPLSLGKDYIEAHHKTPLSKVRSEVKTTLDDLMLVCSNCHRMIHRTKNCEDNLQVLIKHFKSR